MHKQVKKKDNSSHYYGEKKIKQIFHIIYGTFANFGFFIAKGLLLSK